MKAVWTGMTRCTFHRDIKKQQVYSLIIARAMPKLQCYQETLGQIGMGCGLLSGQGVGSEN
jgi:hypothetical protein